VNAKMKRIIKIGPHLPKLS